MYISLILRFLIYLVVSQQRTNTKPQPLPNHKQNHIPIPRHHHSRQAPRGPIGPQQIAVQAAGAERHEEQRFPLLSTPAATGEGKGGGEAALARVVVGQDGQPHGAEEAAVDLVVLLLLWLSW
jgi:hypothetical protein